MNIFSFAEKPFTYWQLRKQKLILYRLMLPEESLRESFKQLFRLSTYLPQLNTTSGVCHSLKAALLTGAEENQNKFILFIVIYGAKPNFKLYFVH